VDFALFDDEIDAAKNDRTLSLGVKISQLE
jgi:hypothetical protein